MLLRFTPAGALDPTFGTNGVGLYEPVPGTTYSIFFAVRIQPDGKIVASGSSSTSSTTSFLVARFLTNGTPDVTFGSGGFITTTIGSYAAANDLQILPSGKIIVVGQVVSGVSEFGVAQFNPDGSPDLTFGTGGVQTYNLGGYASAANRLLNNG